MTLNFEVVFDHSRLFASFAAFAPFVPSFGFRPRFFGRTAAAGVSSTSDPPSSEDEEKESSTAGSPVPRLLRQIFGVMAPPSLSAPLDSLALRSRRLGGGAFFFDFFFVVDGSRLGVPDLPLDVVGALVPVVDAAIVPAVDAAVVSVVNAAAGG